MTSINKNVPTRTYYPTSSQTVSTSVVTPTTATVSSVASNVPTPTAGAVYTAVAPRTEDISTSKARKKDLKEQRDAAKKEMKRLKKEMERLQKEMFRSMNAHSNAAEALLYDSPYLDIEDPGTQSRIRYVQDLEQKRNSAAEAYYEAKRAYEAALKVYEEACAAYDNYEEGSESNPSSTMQVPTFTHTTVTTPPTTTPTVSYPTGT